MDTSRIRILDVRTTLSKKSQVHVFTFELGTITTTVLSPEASPEQQKTSNE